MFYGQGDGERFTLGVLKGLHIIKLQDFDQGVSLVVVMEFYLSSSSKEDGLSVNGFAVNAEFSGNFTKRDGRADFFSDARVEVSFFLAEARMKCGLGEEA